ncbi:DMT family transporter [uncultured Acidaminococcus sp.]|jgi:RarD protein|uniref:DMT family transporter n=1 Tax=uncultured Acidaminococcus sp. TaxID=352152 RepID=UPI0025E6E8CE|nr:DMT family transporter [uncultured Acidaminococcus sp.]
MISSSAKARFSLIFSMLVFAAVGPIVRHIPLPESVIAFCRALLGGFFLFFFACVKKEKLRWKNLWERKYRLFCCGLAMGLNWIFLFKAFASTSVAVAVICYYLAPILVLFFSPFVFDEGLTKGKVLSVLLAFCGMILVSGIFEKAGGANVQGMLYVLLAAFFYACVMMINKTLGDLTPYESTIVELILAALILFPYVLWTEDVSHLMLTGSEWGYLLFLSLFVTGFTYVLFFGALPKLEAAAIALYTYIDPIVAVLLSRFLLHERFTPAMLLGAVLILLPTAVEEIRSAVNEK